MALVLCNLIQVATHSYHSELVARGISGLALKDTGDVVPLPSPHDTRAIA